MENKLGRKGGMRQRAERLARGQTSDISTMDTPSIAELVHELEVHQIELELQNQELLQIQEQLQASLDNYHDLYEFAPSGYFTLDETTDHILEVNLKGARLLEADRGSLLGITFTMYIDPVFTDTFYLCKKNALKNETTETCEIKLRKNDNSSFWLKIEIQPAIQSRVRLALIDITEQKKIGEELEEANSTLEKRIQERMAELKQTNLRLKEENEERVHTERYLRLEEARLAALLRLGQMSETSIDKMANFILEQGIVLTLSKIGFLGFLNEDESIYTLHAVSKDVVKECAIEGNPLQWHIAEAGIWADAIRKRETLFINDYSKPHPGKKGLPDGHPPLSRLMVVPLSDSDRIVAVAGMGDKNSDYNESDARQITLLLQGMWNHVQRKHSADALKEAYDNLEQRVVQRTRELVFLNTTLQQEIIEHKKTEKNLKQSEERLKRSQEIAHLGSWELDLVNDNFSYSDEACRIIGIKPDAFTANYQAFLAAVHPDDRAEVNAAYSKSLKEGKDSYEIEHRIVRKNDLEIRYVYEKCQHIRDDSGRAIRSIGMVHDITERKLAENKTRQLSSIVESSDDAIIGKTVDGIITSWNKGAEKMYGYTEDEVIGKSISLLAPANRKEEVAQILDKIKRRIYIQNFETVRVKKSGKEIPTILTISPIMDERGIIIGASTISHDITELKNMEVALQAYARRITQVQEEERKRVAYELHDDTAQYLGILKMQINALLESGKIRNPEVKEKLRYLEKDADRAYNEVRRFSHELRPSVLEHMGLRASLEQIAEDINKLNYLRVEVEVEGREPDLPEEVKLGLFRIVQEAVSNIRKHAKANRATIHIIFRKKQMSMKVADNGIGFDVREAVIRSGQKGNMGLMSMKERADLIGAGLKIESKPGNGTLVMVELPFYNKG